MPSNDFPTKVSKTDLQAKPKKTNPATYTSELHFMFSGIIIAYKSDGYKIKLQIAVGSFQLQERHQKRKTEISYMDQLWLVPQPNDNFASDNMPKNPSARDDDKPFNDKNNYIFILKTHESFLRNN
jgi:hypothetical protein